MSQAVVGTPTAPATSVASKAPASPGRLLLGRLIRRRLVLVSLLVLLVVIV
ncbi:MAG: hypothetical protein JOY70_04640, partial [Acidisphaera sp.]|nr:hypothetical protein [Acidisphaera sp.]